jgi:hypothetical protein
VRPSNSGVVLSSPAGRGIRIVGGLEQRLRFGWLHGQCLPVSRHTLVICERGRSRCLKERPREVLGLWV